ncbi:flagellar hook-basal body complex protein [Hydrogenoanaerobacterium sp.]|uniref:flagellar hook protein FlgE n=1 Tax=Hydrogenoanaerobacterium sp. TaxID=2953763 RepID=UPI0028A09C8D|nr:flagellar hook-basal body complex protein [Hydrogenoanaerobacterium sp.]
MVRSMYSGVSGMKAHQTRMDVIGNNIANVNTYGFKASRASFKDVYYQTMSGASGGTAVRGGTNPSQVGYGSKIGSVDVLQTRSTLQMTDNGMDAAIAGEGFFQVQDTDGNIFYTRAGMLNVDSAGNLVDSNGNFVLGVSGNPLGKSPSNEKIQLMIPSVPPTPANVQETINGVKFTFSAQNSTKDGNVTFNFMLDDSLPGGVDVSVQKDEMSSSSITVRVNKNSVFTSMEDFTAKMNAAITEANGGKPHPGGDFSITTDPATGLFPVDGLTGAELIGKDFDVKMGSLTGIPNTGIFGGMKFKGTSTSPMFDSDSDLTFASTYVTPGTATDPEGWKITATDAAGKVYTGHVTTLMTGAGSVRMKAADGTYLDMTHPGLTAMNAAYNTEEGTPGADMANGNAFDALVDAITAKPAQKSNDLGLMSKPIMLSKGTEGGSQTVADLSSIAIGADGVIEGVHPVHGRLQLGRLDIVTFENPQGLEQVGNSYFSSTGNSGTANYCQPGSSGSGALAAGSLEMSNVDLSREFSDMIITQRGFQANSRLITVSDEMLNELVNLKR